jgi:hypothetical protein
MLKKIEHKLHATRTKAKREWQRYRRTKASVLKRRRQVDKRSILQSERDLVRQRIHKHWVGYKEDKYSILHKSPYADFSFIKSLTGIHKEAYSVDKKTNKHIPEIDLRTGKPKIEFYKFHNSYQKIYKAKRGFNTDRLDDVVPKILDNPKVKGVLIVFEVWDEETDTTVVVSNYMTAEQLEINQELGETIMEYITKKFRATDTKDKELRFIYLRVIYAKNK